MTRAGFDRLIDYLTPRCGRPDKAQQQALWEDLADWSDDAIHRAAKSWCLGQWGHRLPIGGQLIALASAAPPRSDSRPTPPAMLERYAYAPPTRCPKHQDGDPDCPRSIAAQAVPLITGARTDAEGAEVAKEAMRQICRLTGAKMPEPLR